MGGREEGREGRGTREQVVLEQVMSLEFNIRCGGGTAPAAWADMKRTG